MILALLVLLAGQDPAYQTSVLEAGARADHILSRDLNGDGKTDLLVQNGRDLQVFFPRNGAFGPKPQLTVRLEPAIFLWTFGALEGQKLPAIFTAGARGIQAIAFDGAAFAPPRDLVIHPSLFEGSTADGRAPVYLDFAPDLDRDGRSEVLLFRRDELLVMKQHAGGEFRCLQKLPMPVDTATLIPWAPYQKLTETISVPVLAVGDTNGDGRIDLSYYREESIGIFEQAEDGTFTSTENLDLVAEKTRPRRRRFFQFDVPPRVGDFNQDGLIDIALSFPSKGRVQVYYGRPGAHDFTQPHLMQVGDGWSTGISLEDLNGDRKPELIMGVVRKFGITEGIQVFLSGKVTLELHFYPMEEGGRFSKDPIQQLPFTIPYSFQVTRDSASLDLVFRPSFKGDFDGDGLKDMLVMTAPNTLSIYPGSRQEFIKGKSSGTIAMSPPEGTASTEPFVADLNGDGVSDLLLKHVQVHPPRHVLELKLSRP